MSLIFTVGYQESDAHQFIECLEGNGVSLLIDVRERSASRKPGFSKTSLSERLEQAGIDYEHWREFGTPKPIRDLLRQQGDWEAYRRAYERRLDEQEELIARLAERIRDEIACLMCYERDAARCHRSLIARRMQRLGFIEEPVHLDPLRSGED